MSDTYAYSELLPDYVPADYALRKARCKLGDKIFDTLLNAPPTVVELSHEVRPAFAMMRPEPETEHRFRLTLTAVQMRNVEMYRTVPTTRARRKRPKPLPWYARLGKFFKDEWDKTAGIGKPEATT